MEWNRGPVIGRGSSATVSLAKMVSGEVLAVKSAELTCSTSLQKEQSFISQLCFPYIIKYMGSQITCENNKIMYNLFVEYMPGGTLADLIKNQGGSLEESLIKLYAHQILKGLNHLHSNGMVHCDIKGQNILIGKDGVKIADLGCAKKVLENGSSPDKGISGTPMFMAPEVARGEEQGFGADIWSFGCTIIEMATGCAPWPNVSDPVSALYRIAYSDDAIEFPDWLSSNAKDLLSKCLRRNAKDRWTAKELLQHPFFVGDNGVEDARLEENSPKSVLDRGFWDSMEVFDSGVSSQTVVSFQSVADRIKKLVSFLNPKLPNWTTEENWMTVRGNFNEENAIISQENSQVEMDYEELIDFESPLLSVDREEEIVSSVILEDFLLSHSFHGINVSGNFTDTLNPMNSSSSSFSECTGDEIVSIGLDFERNSSRKLLILLAILIYGPHQHLFYSFYFTRASAAFFVRHSFCLHPIVYFNSLLK